MSNNLNEWDYMILQVNLLEYKVCVHVNDSHWMLIVCQNYKQHKFSIMFVILLKALHISSPELIMFQAMAIPYYDYVERLNPRQEEIFCGII